MGEIEATKQLQDWRIPFGWRSEADPICAAEFLSASRICMYKANETAPEIWNVFQRCIFLKCWSLTSPTESGRRAWQHGSMAPCRVGEHGGMAQLFHFTVLALCELATRGARW